MMCCDDRALARLLDETVALDEQVTGHLEQCPRCQQRLRRMTAEDAAWGDVRQAFADTVDSASVLISVDRELPADLGVQADQIPLDFLDPPRHPELLGRLDRYDIEALIGAGGMGIVFKGFDAELHRRVALKVLAPHLAASGGARQRFAREAKSAAAVVHENVVPIHNVDHGTRLPFFVMQYVAGESLQARVDRDGPLAIDEVLRIGAQIARGLAAAHDQGLVHRDVKPGNVLLESHVDRVLISDFGLARAADDASITRSGVIAGTPHYMAPEQARGLAVTAKSDLFSLGSVLYFMCASHPPFRAEGTMAVLHRITHDRHRPIRQHQSQIPLGLAQLIDRLLAKDPSRRPKNAQSVARALTCLLHDRRHRFGPARRPLVLRVACALLLVLGLAGGTVFTLEALKDEGRLPTPAAQGSADREGTEQPKHSTAPPRDLSGAAFDEEVAALEGSIKVAELAARRVPTLPDSATPFFDELVQLEALATVLESGASPQPSASRSWDVPKPSPGAAAPIPPRRP